MILLITGNSFAQDKTDQPNREQKIQALYIAYMTRQLNLTEDEAQRFWPVHSLYENEIKGISKDQDELDKQQAVLDIKKKYQDRFVKIIGLPRTNDFFKKDNEFRKQMLERLKKMRQQGMPNRGMPGGRPYRRGGNFPLNPND